MKILKDYRDTPIRLTDERIAHVMEHPEMAHMRQGIEETLKYPEQVLSSSIDDKAFLYYRYYENTIVGAKYLCLVIKESETGAFLLTAYLTDKMKKGKIIWKRK